MGIYDQLDSPSLLVNPGIVRRNIAEMVRMTGNVERLRPHIKTHKTAEGIRMMLDAGITKFKCATIAEAELLALQGAPDVLLAHQPVGPKIQRLLELVTQYPATHFSCITDHTFAATAIGAIFHSQNKQIDVYADINVGMNRTGIAPGATALALIEHILQTQGIVFKGLHVYDGQHRQADYAAREAACQQAFAPVYDLIAMMQEKGYPFPHIIAGGSPTFSIHAKATDRDCSPGTNIFWDRGYAQICAEQKFEPAVQILTRVISLPTATRICLDLGHKAVASENEIGKRVFFPSHPDLVPVGQSEEHLVMETAAGHGFQPVDVLLGIPYHVCPTIALHESLYVIENNALVGEWKVQARKRKIEV